MRMWKVPGRQVYCESIASCIRETVWCHVVLPLFPWARFADGGLLEFYPAKDPDGIERWVPA